MLRVLRQKDELGLLDATFDDAPPTGVDLDPPSSATSRGGSPRSRWCWSSNDGTLPLRGDPRASR